MTAPRANRYRTHWGGDLRGGDAGGEVRVAGWVHRRRDHGGLVFIDLRDGAGLVQLVIRPDAAPEAHAAAQGLRAEDVVSALGRLELREPGTVNPAMATGEVELDVTGIELLADADTPPFEIESFSGEVGEELRLRHRYLDLRRDEMRGALELRHEVVTTIRRHLNDAGFLEIETPMLTRSTPEGARDYLVPSRVQPGSWYALPQSPQLFKQLLMVGGLERYYQIARCFRDEDLRADRQPEFTQLDIELSFVEEDDVIDLCDGVIREVASVAGLEISLPIERINYDDALLRYGTDRPDRRSGIEIRDLGTVFASSEFKVFSGALGSGGVVRGLRIPGGGGLPRRRFDELTEQAQALGAKGLVWATVEPDRWRSPAAKYLSDTEQAEAAAVLGAGEGDAILAVADRADVAARVLGELRLAVAGEQSGHDLCWVTDFPMFGRNEEEDRLDPLHHPFTAPSGDLDGDPAAWRSRAYDLVMNGTEIGGGSIRISDPALQRRVLAAIGIEADEAQRRFGFLLEALRYGAPPHGGIAFGLDRIVAVLAGRESIRDVIAFPKTASGSDPLTGAPAPVEAGQLRELGITAASATKSGADAGPLP